MPEWDEQPWEEHAKGPRDPREYFLCRKRNEPEKRRPAPSPPTRAKGPKIPRNKPSRKKRRFLRCPKPRGKTSCPSREGRKKKCWEAAPMDGREKRGNRERAKRADRTTSGRKETRKPARQRTVQPPRPCPRKRPHFPFPAVARFPAGRRPSTERTEFENGQKGRQLLSAHETCGNKKRPNPR